MKAHSIFRPGLLLLALPLILALALFPPTGASAAEAEHEPGEHEKREEQHADRAEIPAALARELDIQTTVATGGELDLSVVLYGKTMTDPQSISHVTARYPGIIVKIVPSLGDTVEAGQVIASVEANSSLQTYDITAPLSGVVVDKHANPGELAGDQSLMTIANYDRIWVDLTVFPGESQRIEAGMPVTVSMEGLQARSSISYLNPSQTNSPTLVARVPIQNEQGQWSPGLLVEGSVLVDQATVDLLVDNDALQLFENENVVFVQEGESYHPRPLILGRSDGEYTEVLSGLNEGERYVVKNSYLIKADLEKQGVEHSH